MNKQYWLLIDDQRTRNVDKICRTASDGLDALRSQDISHLVLDNDLGELIEGHHILRTALEEDICPPNVILITSNPVARERMKSMLQNAGYKTINGVRFTKEHT